jgi:signal transduction histidine kinase/AmiR/NasT family two-component response regulator
MALASPAILIVEDEGLVAKDLQQSLADMGYDAFGVAASCDEALALASDHQPDVVLMDIRIRGDSDGIRTAAILKARHPVIVIFLTAHADDSMIDRAKRTEPDGYLLKPVKLAELHSMIEILLYKKNLENEREKRRATEHRLFTISDNVPIAIAYIDRKGQVQFANQVFRDFVPYRDDPNGVSAMAFLGEDLYRRSYAPRQGALLGERSQSLLDLESRGAPRKIEVTYIPDHDAEGEVIGVYALGYDVTEREQMGTDLRQAHADLETILNAIPAEITSWQRDLTARFANSAAGAHFTHRNGSVTGRPMQELLSERQFRRSQPFIASALAGKPVSIEQVDTESGSTRHQRVFFIPEHRAGEVAGFHTLAFDITELRASRERSRQLAQRLDTVREDERCAVAIILHDGIAQDLFAMKLGVDNLILHTNQQKAVHELCVEIREAVAKCMEDVRQIANELRPIALKYFGIAAAIAEHARQFGARANLDIRISEEANLPPLEEPARLLLFRAAQEALTNVARHAAATHVHITLRADPAGITLTVIDDGTGIAEASLKKVSSLGILALRERAEALGGSLTIGLNLPQGTRLAVRLPAAPTSDARTAEPA